VARSTSKSIVITTVVSLILSACLGGYFLLSGGDLSQFSSSTSPGPIAKAKLTAAALAVDMYASQNGSFGGLNAGAMAAIDTANQWVDGEPAEGQIGISDVTDASYVLTVKGSDGAFYHATKDHGSLIVTDANGKTL
jgi:hypothetical protein